MTSRPDSSAARLPLFSDGRSGIADPARRRLLMLGAGGFGALALAACQREPGGLDEPFPEFALPDLAGTVHTSAEFRGQPLVVNFWATWCPPCRAEIDDLDKLQRDLAPRGVRLLAVSVDSDANLVREFLQGRTPAFLVLMDTAQAWSRTALSMPGLPTTYLVGADGNIRTAWVGARDWSSPRVQSDLMARLT
jgi:peroxiredoxin